MQVAPGGLRIATVPAALALPFGVLNPFLGGLAIALAGAIVAFHRDPDRQPPASGVLSPADGRVSTIREEEGRLRVGIFMGVTNVHVNRAPMAGTVSETTHRPGANKPAFTKDSDRNEQLEIDCGDFSIVLIAGWFARRIRPYVGPGDDLDRGQRIGHISFGSRADVLMPPDVSREDVTVRRGQRVRAGESVIARR